MMRFQREVLRDRAFIVATLSVIMMAAAGCAVDGVGVEGSVGVGYVGGYYEPFGYEYGGWAPGYNVGPYARGRGGWSRDRGRAPAFRPAPGGRPMPSLPGRPRGR